jgi:O-antigen/teichoic acid export membrane protein
MPVQVSLNVLLISLALFVSRSILIVQIDAYSGYGHTGYATLVDNGYGILQTLLQLSVLALGFEIAGLLVSTVIATVVTIVVHLLVSVLSLSRPSVSIARSLFQYGRWSISSAGLSTVYNRLPILFLGYLGLEAEIGYYQAADRLLMLGSYVGASLSPALMAKTSSKTSTGNANEMYSDFQDSHHHVTILAVALAFGGFALSEPLMLTMFNMNNPLAAEGLIILTFYHIITSLGRIEYTFLDGLDLPELNTKSTFMGLLVQSILLPIMYSLHGFLGVLLSIVIAHSVTVVIAQIIFWEKFRTVPLPGGLLPQSVSGLVMFVAVRLLRSHIEISSVFVLVSIVAFGSIVYFSTLLTVDPSFRALSKRVFQDAKREVTTRTEL